MSGRTVFPATSLDRAVVRWEEHLHSRTPVTVGTSGIAYKREDFFAPLGYGGINGSKLRQLIHLVDAHRRHHPAVAGVLTGASVLSPQNSMAALVAAHYGLKTAVVLGGTKPATARRHENVAIAAAAGAQLIYTPVGYNPALQRAVTDLHAKAGYGDYYRLCYGITTPAAAGAESVEAFHAVGAAQAANIPRATRTLVMTAGSCNSAVSVLYGLALHPPPALRRVVLIGIGPPRLDWMDQRIRAIESVAGVDVRGLFTRRYRDHPHLSGGTGPILLEHHDLHTTGWTTYQARRRWRQDDIDFHPTYEGKAMAYLDEARPRWWTGADGDTLFWVVGGAGTRAAMRAAWTAAGET